MDPKLLARLQAAENALLLIMGDDEMADNMSGDIRNTIDIWFAKQQETKHMIA